MLYNGSITIENTETGEYRTFQVKTQDEDARFAPGKRIVSLLTGPNNEGDYNPFAFVSDDDAALLVWRKKRGTDGKMSAYDWYADMIAGLSGLPSRLDWKEKGYVARTERRCRRCNRKLTTPESIDSGIGPVCAGREAAA